MRFLLTISFSFFTFFASAQIDADTLHLTKGVVVKWKEKGKIESIRTRYIRLSPKRKNVFDAETFKPIRRKLRLKISRLKIDKNGNTVKQYDYFKDGSFFYTLKSRYEYDENNNLIRRTFKSSQYDNYEEVLLSKTVKNDTLITKYKNLTKDSTYAYYNIFNDKFHIIEAGNFQNSDRTYFHYDSLGYLIKTENYQDDTLSSIEKRSYLFDENNDLIYWSYYTNGIQEYSEERETIRDENGVIIKETLTRIIDGNTEVAEYQPIFDRKGSWKKAKNLKTGEISKRRVRYYWFRN